LLIWQEVKESELLKQLGRD